MRLWTTPPLSTCILRATKRRSATRPRNTAAACALSHGIVQDMQTAEECENDTYLQAWNAIPPHDPKEYLYDAYYVPAIADAYLENMPVYDGRFN